jgi:hypothetical protein
MALRNEVFGAAWCCSPEVHAGFLEYTDHHVAGWSTH